MKLIAIIFLCSRLLLSVTQESLQEIDCNDEDVFKAVDTALKKYNNGKQSGYQFVLYRVMEVTKTDDPDTFYSFKYQIKEGDCPVGNGTTWQDCDYKDSEQAATGECTATIRKSEDMRFSVATQTCQITPAEGPVVTAQYECLGCLHPISTASPDLEPVLRHAVQYFNNNTGHSHLFALREVKKAQRQDIGECTGKAQVDIQLRVASFSQNCNLLPGEDFVQPPSRICAGCPIDIPVNSTELEEPLNHSIAKLNAENNGTFYFKIDIVKKAKAQVSRETTCSKERNDELTDSCEIHKSGISLLKRPPGFSPFRAAQVVETKEGTTVSPLHTSVAPVQDEEQDSGKEQGPTRGHGRGHGKQIKHGLGHGYKHEHDQGPGHQRGHGLGHGHQKQHGLGHGHQQKINYGLEHQGTHGLGHGHKREHGRGHVKHKNKGKNKGKHNGWKTEHLASSSEDSTTSSAQTQEESEGPTPLPSLAQPGVAVTFPDFQDSALFATVMTNTPLAPTDSDDDWIPDVQIEPNSLSFNLISDFPETTPPKCPGRPWKPVDRMNPTVESKEFHDFSLSDALN
ncbi:hypothetical protein HPG69_007129 [Diceros bicornis minor]|uniref:Cystatin kininogen-type domain-containing protein n=1 Tax=Diceros bicornis minor TaxID=77932 RepID=A0A7J7F2N9_DICBM|nr:hypothetical protein HPG69_007129 [Diceros bicornis minor]